MDESETAEARDLKLRVLGGANPSVATKLTRRLITKWFLAAGSTGEFYNKLCEHGFEKPGHGCRKRVFVHKTFPFVVKTCHDGSEIFPGRKTGVAKYFLWPEFAAEAHARKLYFQPKARFLPEREDRKKDLEVLLLDMKKNGARWRGLKYHKNQLRGDAHPENIARYKGRIVIIDF